MSNKELERTNQLLSLIYGFMFVFTITGSVFLAVYLLPIFDFFIGDTFFLIGGFIIVLPGAYIIGRSYHAKTVVNMEIDGEYESVYDSKYEELLITQGKLELKIKILEKENIESKKLLTQKDSLIEKIEEKIKKLEDKNK